MVLVLTSANLCLQLTQFRGFFNYITVSYEFPLNKLASFTATCLSVSIFAVAIIDVLIGFESITSRLLFSTINMCYIIHMMIPLLSFDHCSVSYHNHHFSFIIYLVKKYSYLMYIIIYFAIPNTFSFLSSPLLQSKSYSCVEPFQHTSYYC